MQIINGLYVEIIKGKYTGFHDTFVDKERIMIGAEEECDILVPEQTVSGKHCVIGYEDGFYRIMDQSSTNGTYLNGKLIGKRGVLQQGSEKDILSSGDMISLGRSVVLCVRILKEDETKIARNDQRLLGKCLLNGYRNEEMLGRGGMGRVRKVSDKFTGKPFALKTMMSKACPDEELKKRFQREMNITKVLHHENIVRVHQTGTVGDRSYILMEFCEGGSVMDLMERTGGILSVEMATEIMCQILDGLSYLHDHELSLVHRDIKPMNILLSDCSDHPIAKISDFGMSKAYDQEGLTRFTKTGIAAGTNGFIPRQQLDYKNAGPEVDIWAAAATYYYMLTGRYPKHFPSDMDPLDVISREKAVPIRERNSKITGKLAQVIDRALLDEPGLFYKSARTLKLDIINTQAIDQGEDISFVI